MKRLYSFLFMVGGALALTLAVVGQETQPVPTLIAPTLVPATSLTSPQVDGLNSTSAVADILDKGVFRIGVLYNDPPYSELNWQGELRGFDIELLRLIAETWETELEFIQVTRQNALAKLNNREVDAVASAFVHYREFDDRLEFTQTYLTGRQALMVRADSAFTTPTALHSSRIGYVLGTRAEAALGLWQNRLGISLNAQHYLTLNKALAALSSGSVDAVIGEEQDLLLVTQEFSESVRILEQAVLIEPHALAVRRRDTNIRNLLNRTIQFLTDDGQLEVLFREYFPGQSFPEETIILWEGIGDGAKPDETMREINYPNQYTIARVRQSGSLRVGGLVDNTQTHSSAQRRLAALNRALVDEIARRWGVVVETVGNAEDSALEQLQAGELDLIVGVRPDWQLASIVDFSNPYLLHGDRLMAPANSRIQGFNDLRGRWIGVLYNDEGARERAQAWADSINASVNFIQTPEASAGLTILEFDNADVIYANNLALIAHLEASPSALRLTDRWYSRSYYAMALQNNDIDFRLLVDYTIQELIVDGTLQRLAAPLLLSDDFPAFEIVPGTPIVAGINLSA